MEDNLSWLDKNIVPRIKAFKNFVREVKKSSPEYFFQDSESVFTEKVKNFMKILHYKNANSKIATSLMRQEKSTKSGISTEHFNAIRKLISEKLVAVSGSNFHIETTIQGYSAEQLINLPTEGLEHLLHLKKEEFKIQKENDDLSKMAFVFNAIKKLESIIQDKTIINNKNPKIMENNKTFDQVEYLKNQLKYLGFGEGEKLHNDLEKGVNSKKQQFEIKATSDKTLPDNKVDFTLKFNKSENGGVFLNSYNGKLTNEKNEEISHNFPVNREQTFTAKEAVNLLEGRTVKIEFNNPKTKQLEPAFVKLNFDEAKTEKGNYQFQNFYKNYGVNTAQIVEKSNLIFDKPEYKESTIKSLEKGNVVKVKFEIDDQVTEGKAVLNPQYKNLNLYDSDMNRLNTNKPVEGLGQDNKHEKNNVKEQSIKR